MSADVTWVSPKQQSKMPFLRRGVKRMVYLGLSGYIVVFLFIMYSWKGLTHTATFSKTEKSGLGKMHNADGQHLARGPQRLVNTENLKEALPLRGVTPRQSHTTMAPVNVDLAIQHGPQRLQPANVDLAIQHGPQRLQPVNVDLAIQHGPQRLQPANNLTQRQAQHNRHVVVEEALPGRFARDMSAHPHFVEGRLEFEDLQHNEEDAPEGGLPLDGDLGLFEKINSRPRNPFTVPQLDEGGNLPDDGGDLAVYDDISLPKQGRVNKDTWISPDGMADHAGSSELHSPRFVSSRSIQLSHIHSRSSADTIRKISVSKLVVDFKDISDVTVYSAFLDVRGPAQHVRIMGIAPITRRPSPFDLWCLFPMTEGVEPSLLVSKQTSDCRRRKKNCYHFLSCKVPSQALFSQTQLSHNNILVVGGKKDNNFLIQNDEKVRLVITANKISTENSADPAKGPSYQRQNEGSLFSVCVPPASLSDKISVLQLVEFVELNRMFGAAHFTFYNFRASKEIVQVLRFYENQGLATILPWSLRAPSDIWDKGEAVAMGDCLYRNMHLFDYVAFLRLDEFIVPHQHDTWDELFRHVHMQSENLHSIAAVYRIFPLFCYPVDTRNNCLTNGDPGHCPYDPKGQTSQHALFVTLRKTLCSENDTNPNQTGFIVRPDRVVELEDHNIIKLVSELYVSFKVDPELASVYQYRAQSCEQTVSELLSVRICGSLVVDGSLAKFEKKLVQRTKRVLQDLNRLV